jgi:PAS domain S-box-containing protein
MSPNTEHIRVLLVEDNPGDALLLREALAGAVGGTFSVSHADSLAAGLELVRKQPFDAILLDLSLPDSQGVSTLHAANALARRVPIIVLTGLDEQEAAIESVRLGAQDYLIKGKTGGDLLARSIRYAIQRKRAQEALQEAHDELEHKVAQRTADLAKANQVLRMVSECNQALVRIDDEREMMQEICRIILGVGGYRMAWVGYAEHDQAKSVRPIACVGFEEGYLDRANISWADNERGRGPTGTAIRLGRPCVGNSFAADPELAPWREQAIKRGFQSSVSLPLAFEGTIFGALTIYAAQPGAFDETQVKVLAELADDLAYGIAALRTRAALRDSQQQLQRVVHSAPVVIWVADNRGVCTLADGKLGPLGLTSEQIVGRHMREIVGESPAILEHFDRAGKGEHVNAEVQLRGLTFECGYSPLRDSTGQITGVICVATDITEYRRVEREVLEATEREQRRIGRDLHDSIQGSLTGLSFMLTAFKNRLLGDKSKPANLAVDVDELATIVRDTLKQTRGLSRGLCPVDLKGEGLMNAIEQLASTTAGLFRVPCQFQCPSPVMVRDEGVATQLYYVCREAVNNALKHAKAKIIVISLQSGPESLSLSVEDDGVGIPAGQCPTGGLGLRTMAYRARMIGASLEVRPGPRGGTMVSCSIHGPSAKAGPVA